MYNPNSPFSEREKEVVRFLMQGKGNKQIAFELGISNRTVEFHLKNIYAKLSVSSRAEAILKLTESDLRKPTGDVPVESTVDKTGDPTDNDANVISWRIPMKQFYYGIGMVLTALLIVVLVVFNRPGSNAEVSSTTIIPTPTVHVGIPTATELVPTQTSEPEPERVVIPPHTVNGYTAAIESYYIDTSHIIFQMRITGEDLNTIDVLTSSRLGNVDMYDENGNVVNSSGGFGPAVDPALIQFEFVPLTLIKGNRFKGQFAFNLYAPAPDYEKILAKFRFDFDLPMYPEVRFYPKQTVTANGLDMLLDSVTVTPVFTQIYLCFQEPSYAPWTIGSQSTLRLGDREASLYNSRTLFSSSTGGDMRVGSEPYWAPPVKNGNCIKIGFQVGSRNPTSLTLNIPDLENLISYGFDPNPLLQLPALYPGLNEKQAFQTYLEENGYTYKGPWVFEVELVK